jgi:hypothetical protein
VQQYVYNINIGDVAMCKKAECQLAAGEGYDDSEHHSPGEITLKIFPALSRRTELMTH